jgi:hypothetical protein
VSPVGRTQSGAGRLALYALVAFGVIGLCLRASFSEKPEPEPVVASSKPTGLLAVEAPGAKSSATTTAALVVREKPTPTPRDPATGQADEPRDPHPITPAHERIFRENHFIGALNGAMDARDAAGLRRLLTRYREDYPEDALGLQEGYELIASCLERPSAETEAAARRYYETETASTLRRHVRRHCLTPEQSP